MIAETWKNPPSLRNLDSRQFEEMVAFIFREFGYEVELTKRTRDGGRDIVAVRRAEIAGRYLIECKQPYSGAKIGIAPVRELYAVKVDERATKAILATTSFFTKEARLFFERHRWELEPRDYDGVMEWIRSYLGGHSE
jgi:HJR/Mrr/RecB family endonuclease